ncbi:trigger factor-like [Dreissena polymorpha]|uniref:Uncharacterized protein n=1 Tax=Dreissena polymorpha TaxID=45954 RepID=A0A9D4DSJ8_DREPO|nr:trigger factor-like [Dreissena polymorpha]KAH3754626.1 hypothetical protein DPMN_189306 [Dreissena polymorpha]
MRLFLVGLLGIVLVWSSQTTADKEDFTNDEILEAEVRANKKSLVDEYAHLQALCGDVCSGEEGDDFTECVDRCELDTLKQLDDVGDDSDDDDDSKDGDGGKDGDDGGNGDDGIDYDHGDAGDDGDDGNEDNDGDDGIADVARTNGEKRVPKRLPFRHWSK